MALLIDGQLVAGALGSFDVINPATATAFAQCPQADQAQVDQAVNAAKAAFAKWGVAGNVAARQEALKKAGQIVLDHLDELAKLLTTEQGKPLAHATAEIQWSAQMLLGNSQLDPPVEVLSDNDQGRVEVHRRPLGVVAGITPWNYPVLMFVGKFAPAVVLGNTFVIKPSPYTPLSTVRIGELFKDVFPPGVLNVITGSDQNAFNVGAYLSKHPLVSKISFTGSLNTGRKIYQTAACDIKRITLELGGNDPAIILPDSDVDEVAPKIFASAMINTGQVCVAVKRVFVHESQHDQLVEKLAECARNAKVGDGLEEGVQYGPLNNKMQFDRINELVNDAKQHGAKIVAGGAPLDRPGYFYAPTIVDNVKEGVRIVDEEQFGPVLPIITYQSVEEAVQRANNTEFGLGGSVWGSDVNKANELASQILSGTVWVNDHLTFTGGPFGGFRQSGLGREYGKEDISAYTELQVIKLAKPKA